VNRLKAIERWTCRCLLTGCLLNLLACSDEQDTQNGAQPDGNLRLAAVTRAGEDYYPLTEYGSRIGLIIATADGIASSNGVFSYADAAWSSTASVRENTQYYIYGYLTNTNTSGITTTATKPAGGDFSGGADLALSGLPVITGDDICIIVGVEKVNSMNALWNVTEGSYGYLSTTVDENYVNLLLDHLYTKFTLQFCIGSVYAELREIRLKTVKLSTTSDETASAVVSLRSGFGIGTPVFTLSNGSFDFDMLPEEKLLTTTPALTGTTAYCVPNIFEGSTLKLTSTYDVYDRKGNKIAERTAENKIAVTGMAPGKSCQLTLTVEPTYLYILSDDDLDNPSIIVSSE